MPAIYFTVLVSGQQNSSLNLPETYGCGISFIVFESHVLPKIMQGSHENLGCCYLPEAVSISNNIHKNTCQQFALQQYE